MPIYAYLAGPDVFLPDAVAHARRKVEICTRHGIVGRPPLNDDVDALRALPADQAWRVIFDKDIAMMEDCDIIIANLTPFRGPSADSGTLIEVGWFLGRGRPIFGYSNSATPFAERSRQHTALVADPVAGLAVEGFGLADNLMIPGAVLTGGGHPIVIPADDQPRRFDALDIFETCVRLAAENSARLAAQNSARLAAESSARLAAQNPARLAAQNSARLAAQNSARLAATRDP